MAFELQAETRTVFGKKVKNLRQEGLVPCQVYGKDKGSHSVQIPAKILQQTLQDAGRTNLINISIDGREALPTLAKAIQYSPIRADILHVDFHAIDLTQTVTVSVPIYLIGQSELILNEGGVLMQGLNTLEIEARPQDLPESFEVDISVITDFSTAILVSDLDLPEDMIIHSSADSMITTIQPPRPEEEEEEETLEGVESILAEPEVITAQEDEEGEAEAE